MFGREVDVSCGSPVRHQCSKQGTTSKSDSRIVPQLPFIFVAQVLILGVAMRVSLLLTITLEESHLVRYQHECRGSGDQSQGNADQVIIGFVRRSDFEHDLQCNDRDCKTVKHRSAGCMVRRVRDSLLAFLAVVQAEDHMDVHSSVCVKCKREAQDDGQYFRFADVHRVVSPVMQPGNAKGVVD